MHFTPPEKELADIFNITWNPDSWGQEEDTQVFATFPSWQNPQIRMSMSCHISQY